ncbi:MAG: hypothetical protein D6714_00190 [Bacteroidetes bacterium]|nr:MAG: hypothetical protein D6714_00190 [Bacteroidota bacterium]
MKRENAPLSEIESLYRQAADYQQKGDVYNAVKLCKKIIKIAPDWSAPFSLLSLIYKTRNEWHPTLYYSHKAVSNNPFDERAWTNMAIAATALRKWLTARKAWNHVGYDFPEKNQVINMDLGLVAVRINSQSRPEIVWARRVCPARARIQSIPQPASELRFEDLILTDAEPCGFHIQNGIRRPVFEALQLLKPSRKWTFIARLNTDNPADVLTLERICAEAGLGFDNWSKAIRQLTASSNPQLPEYFQDSFANNPSFDHQLVAISAEWQMEVRQVLEAWKIVTLKSYSGLRCVLRW